MISSRLQRLLNQMTDDSIHACLWTSPSFQFIEQKWRKTLPVLWTPTEEDIELVKGLVRCLEYRLWDYRYYNTAEQVQSAMRTIILELEYNCRYQVWQTRTLLASSGV